jgi:ATP-dependent RNA helicase RhlE
VNFSDLLLTEPLLNALQSEGYTTATPIQAKAIPHVLEGRDVLGCAQTGTGKTAAFAVPILQRLAAKPVAANAHRRVRCLVLCPTRELATQIGDSFRTYGKNLNFRHAVVFGGVGQNPQAEAFRRGVDIIIATPGRLLDLMQQRLADLRYVEVLVLDEADRMLDMGFIHDIRKIIAALPQQRQNLLFSATIPGEIRRLADTILRNPVTVQVAPVTQTADRIDQSVYFVQKAHKPQLLAHLVETLPIPRAIVFTRTKHGADRVVRQLHKFGIRAEAIHGNKSQNARERALKNFKGEKTPVLVATDIASRGIDIDGITHVVNYDLTHEPETYVHRIGRTARAGAAGVAISFCDHDERDNLRAIERLIRSSIPVKNDHPAYAPETRLPGGITIAAHAPTTQRRQQQQEQNHRHQPKRSSHESSSRDRHPAHPRDSQPRSAHAPRNAGGGGGGGRRRSEGPASAPRPFHAPGRGACRRGKSGWPGARSRHSAAR